MEGVYGDKISLLSELITERRLLSQSEKYSVKAINQSLVGDVAYVNRASFPVSSLLFAFHLSPVLFPSSSHLFM